MNAAKPLPMQNLAHANLVEAAIMAPSADNNQPWRFVSEGDRLKIHLDPRRALPSDVNAMYDLAAIGAAVENLCIAARESGCEPQVEYVATSEFSRADDAPRHVATIEFIDEGEPDPLYSALPARCTSRKLYPTRPVGDGSLDKLADAARRFADVQLDWIGDRRGIRAFARLVGVSDRFRFQYEPFHEEIFRQLRLSPEEAERTRDGLDIRTLDLPPGAVGFLRLLRPWKRMRLINRVGLGRMLTWPSVLSVLRSGALGVVSLPEPTSTGFVEAGRAFQRIWLAAQAEGLALQPLGSLPIFLGQMEQLAGRNLTAAHRQLSNRLGQWFRRLVPSAADRTLFMVFRLGHATAPPFRSLRRPVGDVLNTLDQRPEPQGQAQP